MTYFFPTIDIYKGSKETFTIEWWFDLPYSLRSMFLANYILRNDNYHKETAFYYYYGEAKKQLHYYRKTGFNSLEYGIKDILHSLLNLNHFVLIHSGAKSEDFGYISNMANLKAIILVDCPKIESLDFLTTLNRLEYLNLDFDYYLNNITAIKPLNLDSLKNLTFIKSLHLTGRNISDFSSIQNLTEIEELNLSNSNINSIEFLSRMRYIKRLNLASNNINTLEPLEQINTLEHLDVSNNNIASLSFISRSINLTSLIIGNNIISSIKVITKFKKLLKLDLENNEIDSLKGLRVLDKLCNLCLWDNDIKNYDEILHLKKIKYLYLSVHESIFIKILQPMFDHIPHLFNNEFHIYDSKQRKSDKKLDEIE